MNKQTQKEANYREGDPIDHCGVCRYYLGPGRCSVVAGDISPFGTSDSFAPAKNVFGDMLSKQQIAQIRAIAAQGQAQQGAGAQPPTPPQGGRAPPPPRPQFPPVRALPPQQSAPRPFFG